jgi:hypothetical protein
MMRMAATVTFDHRVMQDISEHRNGTAMARIKNLLERGKVWGYQPEQDSFREALTRQVQTVLSSLHPDADLPALTEQASRVLDIASLLGLQLELWEAQNQLLEAFDAMEASRILTPELRQTFSRLAEKLSISPQLLGWRP